MNLPFSRRIQAAQPSFIREILKVTADPSIISFAGGLPNPGLFPEAALQRAANRCFELGGSEILQYTITEGYPPLRDYIAGRYREKMGLEIDPKNILITNGSQQGLDLLGKVLLNEGDDLILEAPGYLGAIQAFSIYAPRFHAVEMDEEGIRIEPLQQALENSEARLLYTVPNFQNPSGLSYSEARRAQVAAAMAGRDTLLVEDDPYGDIRFEGTRPSSFARLMPERTILLGSFSKTVVPAFRLGWMVAPDAVMEKLVIAKQAADLHSNYFSQRVLHQYLVDNDLDAHIQSIVEVYRRQRDAMLAAMDAHMPPGIQHTRPDGGMFLWASLPEGQAAMDLFRLAIEDKVAFVPGDPFYVDGKQHNTMRLSFTTVDEPTIDEGIRRLAHAAKQLLGA
jgi:2-aminoadipate transaminase